MPLKSHDCFWQSRSASPSALIDPVADTRAGAANVDSAPSGAKQTKDDLDQIVSEAEVMICNLSGLLG